MYQGQFLSLDKYTMIMEDINSEEVLVKGLGELYNVSVIFI